MDLLCSVLAHLLWTVVDQPRGKDQVEDDAFQQLFTKSDLFVDSTSDVEGGKRRTVLRCIVSWEVLFRLAFISSQFNTEVSPEEPRLFSTQAHSLDEKMSSRVMHLPTSSRTSVIAWMYGKTV